MLPGHEQKQSGMYIEYTLASVNQFYSYVVKSNTTAATDCKISLKAENE